MLEAQRGGAQEPAGVDRVRRAATHPQHVGDLPGQRATTRGRRAVDADPQPALRVEGGQPVGQLLDEQRGRDRADVHPTILP